MVKRLAKKRPQICPAAQRSSIAVCAFHQLMRCFMLASCPAVQRQARPRVRNDWLNLCHGRLLHRRGKSHPPGMNGELPG